MVTIFTGSGDPFEDDFKIKNLHEPLVYVSPNGKYWSTYGPIDNKGKHLLPEGSKYHK